MTPTLQRGWPFKHTNAHHRMQTEEIVAQLYVGHLFNSCTVLRIARSFNWAHGLNGEPYWCQTGSWERNKRLPFYPGTCSVLSIVITSFKTPLRQKPPCPINRLLLLSLDKSVDLICEASGHWNEQWLQLLGICDFGVWYPQGAMI